MHGVSEPLLTPQALAGVEPFACGALLIHPAERVIRGPAGEASLQPRAMQVLVALCQAAGRVVTRGELLRRCWGAGWAGDDSLNRAVGEIRRGLVSAGSGGVRIDTVPRTGYRLLSDTPPADNLAGSEHYQKPVEAPAHGAGANIVGSPTASISLPSRRSVLVGAGLFAGAAVAGGWALWPKGESREVRALIAQGDNAIKTGMPDGLRQGVGFLQEAVRLAPDSADAWGRLALAHTVRAEQAGPGEAAEAVLAAQQSAARALALKPHQENALGALAILPPYFGAWHEAEKRMKEVLAIHPRNFPTLDAWWFLKMGTGLTRDGATRRIDFASAEPLHAGHQQRLMYAYDILGRHAEADQVGDRALTLWPKHPGIWLARLLTYVMAGRLARARAHFEDDGGRPDLPPHVLTHCRAWLTALETRKPSDIEIVVRQVLELFSKGPSAAILGVLHMVTVGRVELAMDMARAYLLEEGPLIAGVRWRPGQISVNDQRRRKTHMLFLPVAAPLRAHPNFDALVQKIGLKAYWRQARVVPDFAQPSLA